MSPVEPQPGAKSRRVSQACDYCHRRAIRCRREPGVLQCHNCTQFNQPCTYARQPRRRGVKPKVITSSPPAPTSGASGLYQAVDELPLQQKWTAPFCPSQAVVMSLAEVYFEVVYPIFPFFHQPTFLRRISRGEHTSDRHLFSTTMALCALVSARVRDKALFDTSFDTNILTEISSEEFYQVAARASNNTDTSEPQNLESLRTCALLALTAIQYGRIREMQAFLGRYHTLVAMDALHDESNWPLEIGIVEREERRRLFWSIYTLEIFASIVWGGVLRVREQQIRVSYPVEIDDELFSDRGYDVKDQSSFDPYQSPGTRNGEIRDTGWLCGWNFTTDLYRILEHVITNFRDRKKSHESFPTNMFYNSSDFSMAVVSDSVMRLYVNLPKQFKEVSQNSQGPTNKRYSFQTANIMATVQLLRMLLFASGGGSIEERCKIASDVIDAFSRTPTAYLRAISSPLLHHLAGIGLILGSVFEEPMSEHAYQQVRGVLLALAQLLENLELGMHSTKSAQRLRDLSTRLDHYMDSQKIRSGHDSVQSTYGLPDNWSWSLDFMQLADSWTSTSYTHGL